MTSPTAPAECAYDVVIIGAGVSGCAIARELSRLSPERLRARGRGGRLLRHIQG